MVPTSKPEPSRVKVQEHRKQDDSFDATPRSRSALFTTDETEAPLFRLSAERAQWTACGVPVDGGQDHHRPEVQDRRTHWPPGRRGHLALNQAILVFLGLAVPPRTKREA